MKYFSNKLLEWYNPTTRYLPWKQTNDAYKIWLSEIILQQTRVEQGTPYYLAFIKKYPTINKLAAAPLDEVLKLWEGLGYYARARNLHFAAQQVVELHQGKFPTTYQDVLKLKGIGIYTAAAIVSFAYNLPYAVVDGNVYRVLSRVFGIATPIDSTEGKKQFANLAQQLLDKKNPATYNQAIMDFGALVCKPKNPLCNKCCFSTDCQALILNKIDSLPVKAKQLLKTERYFHYFVIYDAHYIYIKQRSDKDIWNGLFEFPMVESSSIILKNSQIPKEIQLDDLGSSYCYKQTLSHQHINASFYEIKRTKLLKPKNNYKKIAKTDLNLYAFPKIIHSYLSDRLIFLS